MISSIGGRFGGDQSLNINKGGCEINWSCKSDKGLYKISAILSISISFIDDSVLRVEYKLENSNKN